MKSNKKKNYHGKKVINSAYSYNKYLVNLNSLNSFRISFIFFIKKTNDFFWGLQKHTNGSLSSFKCAAGLFLGDYLKHIIYPIIYFRKFLIGCKTYLCNLMVYFFIFNLSRSYKINRGIAQAAGTFCQILNFVLELNLALVLLPSKKRIYLNFFYCCTLGRNSNYFKNYNVLGSSKWLTYFKKKPSVRGVAKNPVDHPHGGRTKTNKPEVSPWGWVTKHSH